MLLDEDFDLYGEVSCLDICRWYSRNWTDFLFDMLQGFTDIQLQMVEDNTVMVHNREKEIAQIVKSINDLNEIFKDLGSMIVDQVGNY